jgi:S1-C subfamily serine protease
VPANANSTDLNILSSQLADAVQAAAAWTVRVHARRGPAASGIVVAPDRVLTADHVIEPAREGDIRLGLPDGGELKATLVGRDPATDLAVLRVGDTQLTPAAASIVQPRVGSLALLVARPDGGLAASLALVSGLGGPARTRRGGILERFIQVDAVMYPGFSGGPLVDPAGAVLGMSTSGLAFGGPSIAIPWDLAPRLSQMIVEHGRVRRGYLGIGSQPVALSSGARELAAGQERGLLVVHVAENGPAAQAGFLQGDILVRLDGGAIANADDLQSLLGPDRVGATLRASVVRGSELRELSVTVGARE